MSEFMMNGLDIPAPVKWSVVDQPVTTAYSGKQTLDGKLHNSVIRHRRVITCQYGFLGSDEVNLLRDLPLSMGKLDREFLSDNSKDEEGQTILRYLIAMAKVIK